MHNGLSSNAHSGVTQGGTALNGAGHGTVVAGRYRLQDRARTTPDGAIWNAVDETLERPVVVRVIRPGHPRSADIIDAARRAALVDDARLARVLDVGEAKGITYIVTEQLAGRPLEEYLQTAPLPSETVRRIVGESAQALDRAGQRGLHHLALTPNTVWILPDGAVKIVGMAIEAAAQGVESENARDAERRDVADLVRVVYAGLTGRWPESAESAPASTALAPAPLVNGRAVSPRELASSIPVDLNTLCQTTLNLLGRGQGGPHTPKELADRLSPWARTSPLPEPAALDMRLPASRRADTTGYPPIAPAAPTSGTSTTRPAVPDTTVVAMPSVTAPPPPDAASAPEAAPESDPTEKILSRPDTDNLLFAPESPVGTTRPIKGDGPARNGSVTAESDSDRSVTGNSKTGDAGMRLWPNLGAQRPESEPSHATHAGAVPTSPVAAHTTHTTDGPVHSLQTPQPPVETAPNFADEIVRPTPPVPTPAPAPAPAQRSSSNRPNLPLIGGWSGTDDDRLGPFLPQAPLTSPSREQTRLVIGLLSGMVIIGLVLSIFALRNIFDGGGGTATTQSTRTTPPGSTASRSAQAPAAPQASADTQNSPAVASGEPLKIVSITSIDPDGDGSENPRAAPWAIDGDPSTQWRSERYDTAEFGGLPKKGVGLVLDLGEEQQVSQVVIDHQGSGGTLELRTATGTDYSGSELIQKIPMGDSGQLTVQMTEPIQTRYLLLWFTKVPQQTTGEYRLRVIEVSVR